MKVSIIIPVYNVSKYIERCLLSALNQTWQDLEIILVDDCTPDNSMEIARRVVASHARGGIVTFLKHDENRGLSAARNTGIAVAQGEYVYFSDSDDYLPDNSMELLADSALRYSSDLVVGNFQITGADRWAPPLQLPTGVLSGSNDILSSYARREWYVMACNKLVNKTYLLRHELYFQEGIIHEDDLWSFKMACTAQTVSIVNLPTYYYFMQPNSIMRAPSLRNLECRVAVIGYMYDYICSAKHLSENRFVYSIYENSKAAYFDRIIYFTKDTGFHYRSYQAFRQKKYISAWKAVWRFHPGMALVLRNLHYALPCRMGYLYFKLFVQISYYWKVLPIKLRKLFRLK
ncbi:MAG: glycosyltransferase [Bacteroides sp.]|nr:glycosyltransferase [Bacteroides sp.]